MYLFMCSDYLGKTVSFNHLCIQVATVFLTTFYCSGLTQGHTECFLVVLNKSTWKQRHTPHTHGYGLKKEKTCIISDIELKCNAF